MILSDALILPLSQLLTQLVMTSQIRSHIEYADINSKPKCLIELLVN